MIEYDNRSWTSVLFRLKGSVLPRLFPRIAAIAGLGAGAAVLYGATGFHLSPLAHTLIGAALGLLLVFRTNASYDRFWEGRKLLGTIVNRSRDLARQFATWVDDEDTRQRLRRRTVAMVALIHQMLRRETDLRALGERLTDDERALLEPLRARQLVVSTWISRALRALADDGKLAEQRLVAMDQNLTTILDQLGGAERILKTPVPFAYAQHIRTFVSFFCVTVPFAMVDTMRWYTPLASALLAFALFGIEEIGIEIEDPFGYDDNDLPLDAILDTIDKDTLAILTAPAPRDPHG
ncbi:MAG: bestrophin family ion channel [Polyangiaceae bacterium]